MTEMEIDKAWENFRKPKRWSVKRNISSLRLKTGYAVCGIRKIGNVPIIFANGQECWKP